MGANPRLAAPAGMTSAVVTAAEGSAYSCTDGCTDSSSGGRSVGATAPAGGGGGGSSNRTDGCDDGDGDGGNDIMWIGTPVDGWSAGAAALRGGAVGLGKEAAVGDEEGSRGCWSPG
jgi:hypothetical protein